ncbi:MAG: MFS transporter [Myxococcota bacterium]
MTHRLKLFYLYRFLGESFFFVPALWPFLESRGLAPAEILLLNSFFCVVVVVFEVPTGALADRIGRRPAMMLGSLAMAVACLTYYVSSSFAAFAAAEALLALGLTLMSGADSAYLYDGLADDDRASEYARREGTASGFKHAGYAIACAAGGLLARIDLALPYLVTAATCAAAFVAACFLREPSHVRRARGGPRVRAAVSLVVRSDRLRYLIAYSALVFCLVRVGLYLYQPALRQAGYDVASVGLILGGLHMLAAWTSHRSGGVRATVGEHALMTILPLILAAGYLVLSQAAAWWCVTVLVLQAAANGVYSPLVKDLMQREIPDSRVRATVLSVESMARRVAFGLFTPLVAAAFGAGGLPGALLASGAAGLAGTILLIGLRRREPREVARAEVAIEPPS